MSFCLLVGDWVECNPQEFCPYFLDMDTRRQVIRHFLATIAYRTGYLIAARFIAICLTSGRS